MGDIFSHPILRREWGFQSPERVTLRYGITFCLSILMPLVLGRFMGFLPFIMRLSDMAWMVAFLLIGLFGFANFLLLRSHLASPIPGELRMAPIDPRSTAGALHLAYLPVWVIACSMVIVLLPQGREAFFPVPLERLLLFLVTFLVVLEAVLRVLFFLTLHLEGVTGFFAAVVTLSCGVVIMYGVGGAIEMFSGSHIYTALAWVLFAVLPILLSAVSWRFFIDAAGRSYERRVRLLLGEEAAVVDAPVPRRFLD